MVGMVGGGVSSRRTPRETPRGAGGNSGVLPTLRVPVSRTLHEVQQAWARSDSTAHIHRQCRLLNPNCKSTYYHDSCQDWNAEMQEESVYRTSESGVECTEQRSACLPLCWHHLLALWPSAPQDLPWRQTTRLPDYSLAPSRGMSHPHSCPALQRRKKLGQMGAGGGLPGGRPEGGGAEAAGRAAQTGGCWSPPKSSGCM